MPEDLNTRTNRKCSYCVTIGMLLFYQAQGACEGTLDTRSHSVRPCLCCAWECGTLTVNDLFVNKRHIQDRK